MAMGTVPCLLWKWWTWWVVLREEETLAATAGQGKTKRARERTSLKRKAGLAHTTGEAAAGLGTCSKPLSTSSSTSCSIGARPERNIRPLPLIEHKQEVNISNASRAHNPLVFSPRKEILADLKKEKNTSQKEKKKFLEKWKKNSKTWMSWIN